MSAEKTKQQKKLRDLIDDIEIAMFVTETAEGMLHARPMATRTRPDDERLYFFTDKDSVKVFEIKNERNVNISYCRVEENRYVSVSGNARVVNDKEKINQLWTSSAKLWFPKGVDDPRLSLIEVTPVFGEYWDEPQGVYVKLKDLSEALYTGKRIDPELAENEKVDLQQ